MPDGGDGVAELTVNAAAVVEFLVGWPGGALVLNAADAADAHNQDDEHEDEGYTEGSNDDVEGVPRHVGEALSHVPRLPLQVDFTVCSHPAMRTVAGVTIGLVQAGSSMMTGVTVTFIDVNVTLFTCEPGCTDTRAIQPLAVTGTSIQTADVSTGVLVQFTVCSFVLCQAHTLVAIDKVPAGGSIQARGRQALIVFFLAVEAMVTWIAEALVAGAHATAHAMSTRAEGTEVHKLSTCRPCEARAAAAGEVHTIHVAGAIVLAWRRHAGVYLLFTSRAKVSFQTLAGEPAEAGHTCGSISARV